jgi:5-methylthioadenosine/S-adenosylhomocysteine deaminase
MALLIRDTTVITCDAERRILTRAAVAVEGDRIAALGPSDELARRYPQAEVVDGRGKAVLPGLINSHTHVWYTAARGMQEDFGYPATIPTNVHDVLSAEEYAVFAMLGAIECIRSGSTTLFEIGSRVEDYVEPLCATGLRLVLGLNGADLIPESARGGAFEYSPERGDRSLARQDALISRWHGARDGLISCFATAHAPETCSPRLLHGVQDLASKYGVGRTVHLNQSQWEVDSLLKLRGVRPTEYVDAEGFLGPDLIAAHCRFMNDAEIAIFGRSGSTMAFNPVLAARRGVVPRAGAIRAAGGRVVTGSDNMAHDMVEVLRLSLMLGRIENHDDRHPQPEDVLEWATRDAAGPLRLPDVGSLEPGKKADLILLNARKPHLVPTVRLVATWVHNGQASDVESVMVNGQWLMRDNRVLVLDEAAVVDQAEAIARAAWRRMMDRHPSVSYPISLD